MSDSKQRPQARDLPALPDPPFLCSDCRHGTMMVQKLLPWWLSKESWQEDAPPWYWRVTCESPRISPEKFAIFWHPIVECDAFRARKLVTTDDVARKAARQGERKRKRRQKRKKRSRPK